MKHIGLKAASFASVLNTLAVLSPLVAFAAGLAGALPARGADVTFTEHVISTPAGTPTSVFATDVDGDGDIDVLSTTFNDTEIAWHENVGGSPPTFTDRVITTDVATGAESVFATDLDGDGDIDVISAERSVDHIVVYFDENGSLGFPPQWPRRTPIPTGARGST